MIPTSPKVKWLQRSSVAPHKAYHSSISAFYFISSYDNKQNVLGLVSILGVLIRWELLTGLGLGLGLGFGIGIQVGERLINELRFIDINMLCFSRTRGRNIEKTIWVLSGFSLVDIGDWDKCDDVQEIQGLDLG